MFLCYLFVKFFPFGEHFALPAASVLYTVLQKVYHPTFYDIFNSRPSFPMSVIFVLLLLSRYAIKLLSARPAVTPATLKRAATSLAAW